jgi:4-amino-4-deoxy-L-arabinose transferase-like glycosyltransferase
MHPSDAGSRPGATLPIVLLVLLCAPIFFFRLGRPGLGDPDEGRNAEAAREMAATGDWVTPRLDGVVYLDKPPAFFWVVALSFKALGVSELTARAPSALFALAGVALVGWFARRRLGSAAGTLAGLTLALSPLYIVFGRIVIFDMMLTFCMTVASLAAFEALESERRRILPGILFFAAGGVGTISKGPVAMVLPLLVAIAWAFARKRPRALGRLRFGTGALVYFAVIVPWLVLVESRNPGYLRYAIVGENLERMTSNRFETARPFYFYARVVLPGLFPWIILCAAAAWRRTRAAFKGRPLAETWRAGRARLAGETDQGRLVVAYAAIWLCVTILFFSLIASKRPSYMLPCAAPVAILSGRLWSRAFERRREGTGAPTAEEAAAVAGGAEAVGAETARGALTTGLAWLAGLCLAGALVALLASPAGLALGASQAKYDALLSRTSLFGSTAAGLLVAGALLLATRRLRRPTLSFAAAVLSIAVVVPLAHAASGFLDEARSSRPLSRFLAGRLRSDDVVVCYEQYRPGLNFYLRRRIHLLTSGTAFSSWYVMAHLDELRRDPTFPVLSSEQTRRLLAAPVPEIYVVAPRRMYERMRAELGDALRPDPIYEDLGAGLFVRAGQGHAPIALGDAARGVLSFGTHRRAGGSAPG